MHRAGCAAISIPWPRRWKTSCAMRFDIRQRAALSGWMADAMATSGIYGWRTKGGGRQRGVLSGAIRHSPAGGIVRLDGRRNGNFWHLWREDEGGGVAEADLERIFSPFTRLDGSRRGDGGFGLGLSIARNAVQRQGGTLWAENGKSGLRLNLRLVADDSAAH